ncbi:P-loop containing nucleoside triphosphate hydrolase protein [Calycina marina]|uniref:P-loop containing nucleoside triphosphate hydrolase protein n=1 Tax=Calycina marina TaxID=1763456 RepID=A0A9P8CBV7_9HELO|nr:P-loop containing nucleoside triphosphate hydrolase protein [Calycina marina]
MGDTSAEILVGRTNVQNPVALPEMTITSSIEGLQTEEQNHVLNIITQLRKCGLDSVLQLPQIVVCGDQSAEKSSVLEALTEFPRSDNLCTRYATEIILRQAVTDSLTIKLIPDSDRSAAEKESINSFKAVITNFDDLPDIMAKAMSVMGIESDLSSGSIFRAFAKDVLSIEIEGPTRPQLTLVDLPGLM